MLKQIHYDGLLLSSYDIDGVPCALMSDILNGIISSSWSDYQQVLNSGDDIIQDLDIKSVDDAYLIPITNISKWLYTFSIRRMKDNLQDRFRMYRRDLERSFSVAWAIEVSDLNIRLHITPDPCWQPDHTLWDLSNIFANFGIPDDVLEGCDKEGRIYGPLHYIQLVAGSIECGPRGAALANQIEYIENLPGGVSIIQEIGKSIIANGIPQQGDYLDEYLDDLNKFISCEATYFVGEWDAE